MASSLHIQSHKGVYEVKFDVNSIDRLNAAPPDNAHFIIDRRVSDLYVDRLKNVLDTKSVLHIDATERNKSLDKFPSYVEHLITNGLRRNHCLIGIGGGIIQDITCFLSATMMRGVEWQLYPTTLLSQADSCVGSKSSINSGDAKNILGTFTPPNKVHISTEFLSTLDPRDVRSGVGEILKVHAISGPDIFDQLAQDYDQLFIDSKTMEHYIRRALEIKKPYVEEDEFDRDSRNIFNYGHSFGHAIESATEFEIPHGIAVTMGMDMANFVAMTMGIGSEEAFQRMHSTLRKNYQGYETHPVPLDSFVSAISKDKKNIGENELVIIVPNENQSPQKCQITNSNEFQTVCQQYFKIGRDG